MSLTPAQKQAVSARGNVLVIAGAGTGKTKTLVERCLSLILDEKPPVSIDELLMVTFTDAAAAEMRKRIRARLEEEAGGDRRQRCFEQLALLDSAFIGTIHSFCYSLIRQHFYELEIDPQAAVMPQEESRLLAAETLRDLLASHYAGTTEFDGRVRDLVRMYGGSSDEPIRQAILRIHHYTQTLHDPAGWFERQIKDLSKPDPCAWREMLSGCLVMVRDEWLGKLQSLRPSNPVAQQCADALSRITGEGEPEAATTALRDVLEAFENCPAGKKTAFVKPIESCLVDAKFLLALMRDPKGEDPLAQDWEWFRQPMLTLLQAAREFSAAFANEKRELGALDFHDLEQFTLCLLWDFEANRPTPMAGEWRAKLKFIFVDEYQDVNKAQDQIITALSRESGEANRFLVGDVKQSIYRFRLASPVIFREYAKDWKPPQGTTIPLSENFRSRESLLNFTNSVFQLLMKPEVGGINYAGQELHFGNAEERKALASSSDAWPRVEMHLRIKGKEGEIPEEDPAAGNLADLLDAEKEARLVGIRLLQLMREQAPVVWDEQLKACRAPEWKDVAILLRAPSSKSESYAKAFAQLGIPLEVAKRGFYTATEITDLTSLLQVLDNPLQDIPLLAVLHSPLGNFSANELAEIRLASKKTRFFTALTLISHATAKQENPAAVKAGVFLENYRRWRRLSRQASVSTCLETILAETHYSEWLLAQNRGAQRHANVQRLVALAREFDQFQRRGLMRFLGFLINQQESDVEPAVVANSESRAVTLMSIHQSKGLEFPIVLLPDLGKGFNDGDLKGRLLLSEASGLCSDIKPPNTQRRYPSLPLWLARRAEKREMLGEEMRLLYVAMTRARDMLILSATLTEKRLESIWRTPPAVQMPFALSARSCADWIGFWFGEEGRLRLGDSGATDLIRWKVWSEGELAIPPDQAEDRPAPVEGGDLAAEAAALVKKLSWTYPHPEVTAEPAKTSVSVLRRRAQEQDDEFKAYVPGWSPARTSGKLSGASRGSAHHAFLEQVSLDRPGDVVFLREQVDQMVRSGVLTQEESAALDLEGIAAFWNSEQGRELLNHKPNLRRELPFTVRFTPSEVAGLAGLKVDSRLEGEFVVVQGVADLVAILEGEIWLFDFKSDKVDLADLAEKLDLYQAQMAIYGAALSRIYGLPVMRSCLFFIQPRMLVPVTGGVNGARSPQPVASTGSRP